MLVQCQMQKQSNFSFLLHYHHIGMQQHIWIVAEKLCVLSETQNPIPALLLQVFHRLVTQYMPVSQGLQSLKY